MTETEARIDPLAVTYVREWKPDNSDAFKTAQDRLRIEAGSAEPHARFRLAIPERRELVSGSLEARGEDALVGNFFSRSVDAGGSYRDMTWNTRPDVIVGSADRDGTVGGGASKLLTFPVTLDVQAALAADLDRVAFRLSASSASAQWLRTASLALVLVTRPASTDPTDLAPLGLVGTLKPVFTWTAPAGITKIRLEISTAADFSAIVYDSGELDSAVPRVDTTTGPAWAGLSGTTYVRVSHFTTAGWSGYQTGTVEFLALTDFVISNPGASDADPTAPSAWTPDAQAVEIISYLDGVRKGSTGIVTGPLGTLTPAIGATKAGQVLKRVHRLYDGEARVAPPYVEVITETTFTPIATVPGLTTLSVVQVPGLPAVDVGWTRVVGGVTSVPDEVATYHGDDAREIVLGTEQPHRDWTLRPNTYVDYGGRAVVNGEQSEVIETMLTRTVVEDVWLVDPVTERGVVIGGLGIGIGYGGEVVVHTPIDGAVLLRRTLTRRGPEGTIEGRLKLWPGRTRQECLDDVEWLAERPQRTLRLILGDLNIPVTHSRLQVLFDKDLFFTDRPEHNVSFECSHAGGN